MPRMKFFMTPGSCSTGIHILLEEIGLIFEARIINLLAGDQFTPEYLAINPRGSVPALQREDESVLTTYSEIALWLAEAYPKRQFLSDNAEERERALSIMNYCLEHMHAEGFARIFVPDRFSLDANDAEDEKALGRKIVERGLNRLDRELEGRQYVVRQFGIADSALFYIEFWADRSKIELPANCRAHYEHMLDRPSVRQVLMEEGYASIYRNRV